jgi:hypothetical protein
LPTPPSNDIANSSNDWMDVGANLLYKGLRYICIALGAIILVGVAGHIYKALQTAHEKQDLGHFFKILGVGAISAAIGLGLLYAAINIVPETS